MRRWRPPATSCSPASHKWPTQVRPPPASPSCPLLPPSCAPPSCPLLAPLWVAHSQGASPSKLLPFWFIGSGYSQVETVPKRAVAVPSANMRAAFCQYPRCLLPICVRRPEVWRGGAAAADAPGRRLAAAGSGHGASAAPGGGRPRGAGCGRWVVGFLRGCCLMVPLQGFLGHAMMSAGRRGGRLDALRAGGLASCLL